jgi:CubicO group peptidase (beta-lactamase class C family)
MLKRFLLLVASCLFISYTFAVDVRTPNAEQLKDLTQQFDQYAQSAMTEWGVPGCAIAIVKDNKVIFAKGYGTAFGSATPIDVHTVFHIDSLSKAFTSALMAMLVDKGKIKWTDPVIKYLPDLQLYDPWVTDHFTLRDMLSHNSGMPAEATDSQVLLGYQEEHILNTLKQIKPEGEFRNDYAYQDVTYRMAAAVLEKVTGKTWDKLVSQYILNSLDMNDSSATLKGYLKQKNVARPYVVEDGKNVSLSKWPDFLTWNIDWRAYYTTAKGAAGVNSSILDMAKWVQLQLNQGQFNGKQIISAESMDYLHAPKTIMSPIFEGNNSFYIMGWMYTEYAPYPMLWHNGGSPYFHSMLLIVPKEKLGIVILSTVGESNYVGLPEALALRFVDQYFNQPPPDVSGLVLHFGDDTKESKHKVIIEFGADKESAKTKDWANYILSQQKLHKAIPLPPKPEKIKPALALENYAGTYQNDFYGEVKISAVNDQLILEIGPLHTQIAMNHWNANDFVMEWGDQSLYSSLFYNAMVKFSVGSKNSVAGFTINTLDAADGSGAFVR